MEQVSETQEAVEPKPFIHSKIIIYIFFLCLLLIGFAVAYFLFNIVNSSNTIKASLSKPTPSVVETVAIPISAPGEYFSFSEKSVDTPERRYPIVDIYKYTSTETSPIKIVSLGKKDEYVHQILLLERKEALLINTEKKILLYSIATATSRTIFNTELNQNIDSIVVSQDEETIAAGVTDYKDKIGIVIINLQNTSSKFYRFDTLYPNTTTSEKTVPPLIIRPKSWTNKLEISFVSLMGEGGEGQEKILDTSTGKVLTTATPIGKYNFSDSKQLWANQLPPYGGCYTPTVFHLEVLDRNSGKNTLIQTRQNTEFSILYHNKTKDKVLFSAQEYIPLSHDGCPSADHKEIEYYTFDFTTNKIEKVTSYSDLFHSWYPEIASFLDKRKVDTKNTLRLDSKDFLESNIIYLGKIE